MQLLESHFSRKNDSHVLHNQNTRWIEFEWMSTNQITLFSCECSVAYY